MKGAGIKTELLVTDEERITKLLDLLGTRFSNHGQLLLPTYRQYEALDSDEGLEALTKEFCRWLGYKPRQLTVRYGEISSGAYYTFTEESIIVNEMFREHPLVTGGIVACATLRFIIEQRHYLPDDRFIEVGAVETGLALWIINALKPRRARREKFYHMIDSNWQQLEGIQLESMTDAEFLRQFSIFTTTNRHFPEEYGRGVSKRNLHLLPKTPSTGNIIPLAEPTATHNHIQAANALWTKIALLSLTASAVALCGLFVITHHTKSIAFDEVRDAESLRVIKASLGDCIQKASKQQSTYDPNDLFMTRQIDATKTRCESLRNQYNEALSQYEQAYIK